MTFTTHSPAGTTGGSFTADRNVCSAVHLSEGFARYVLTTLTAPSLQALGPSPGMDLVGLARHAALAVARHRRLHLQLGAVLAIGLVLVPVALLGGGGSVLAWLCMVALGCWSAGFAVLLAYRLGGYRLAVAVRDQAVRPRDLAPRLDPSLESYLAAEMASNVVVFSGGAPFVGSGQLLASWKLNVNCTRAAQPAGRVGRFTAADLHKDLTLAARATGIPGLEVRNRLFVAGTAVTAVPGLLGDPLRRPGVNVSTAELKSGIVNPQPTMRTYLCLRKISWGGDLVVEVFVRVERTAAYLFVEHHAYVLLPLRTELCAAAFLPHDVTGRAVRRSLRGTLGELLGSPAALVRDMTEAAGPGRIVGRQRKYAARSPIYDYGATTGLREQAASSERFATFQFADEDRDLGILRQAILESVFDFLQARGIDTSEFTRQQTSIVNNSYSIGSITNGSHVFGPGGTVVQQPGAANPPATPAAPWAPAGTP
jgi:hypothetical protein